MEQSRVKNTVRNSVVGIFSYLLTSALTFVSRTVFIQYLGEQYLGISGLYSNILAVLALSDLGVNTVMVYSLYRPIAEHDMQRISALIHYFKKLYGLVAIVIATLGILCIPLLPYIVNESLLTQEELIRYYLLVLANSVCSYLAISKSTLIRADQNMNIIQGVQAATSFLMHIAQIIILVTTRNYTIYLVMPIVGTMTNNVLLTLIANKKYPYLKEKIDDKTVAKEIKVKLFSNLKATFLYKLGATIINSTDNILISIMAGTVVVGYYNNYYTIVTMVNAIINIGINSVLASIGNYYTTKEAQDRFGLFKLLLFGFYALAGFCAASYLAVFDDFIAWWIGDRFVLDTVFLLALVANCTVACISNPLWMSRESSGVFESVRYVMISAALINIALSILLGKIMGLAGIILATALARLVTLFWYEPRILCKKVFQVQTSEYWGYILRLPASMLPSVLCGLLVHQYKTTNLFVMILKVVLCGIVSATSYFGLFYKSAEVKKIIAIIQASLRRFSFQKKERL